MAQNDENENESVLDDDIAGTRFAEPPPRFTTNKITNYESSIAARVLTSSSAIRAMMRELTGLPQLPEPDYTALYPRRVAAHIPTPTVHTQVDYIHYLVPDLLDITNCKYYWGVMDRYEADELLKSKPEGTFLLRDSSKEEFLFSVSFRRYRRTLHARVEESKHMFSFDSNNPAVFKSHTICGLVEHYEDPSCCYYFEPFLMLPVNRPFPFSLQHLCRATICSATTYDGVDYLPLPILLREYLKYYHYKQKVRTRSFDCTQ